MRRALRRIRLAWDSFFFAPVGPADLCVGRLVFFSLAFLYYVRQDFSEWGTVAPEFWMPITVFRILGLHPVSPAAITVIQTAWKVSLALAALGLWTRWATIGCFAGGLYLLGLPHNFGQTQHFDTLTVLVFGILAASRAGDAWSIDALRRSAHHAGPVTAVDSPSPEYRWPIRTIWVTAALIFFAAGVSKWRHSGFEWVFSDHLGTLLVRYQYHVSDGEPLTSAGPIIASYPWAPRVLAAFSILTQTLYPLVLFSARARLFLVPAGLAFLLGIRLLMGPTFESFALCNIFWIPWSWLGDRIFDRAGNRARHSLLYDGACGLCRRTVAMIARADLLSRVELVDVTQPSADLPRRFPGLSVEDCLIEMWVVAPNGSRYSGFDAYRRLSLLVPAMWPLAPVFHLPGVRPIGRLVYGFVASHRGRDVCPLPVQPEQR